MLFGATILAIAAASLQPTPTVTATSYDFVVTMFSDPGDYVGQGTSMEFDRSNTSVTGTVSTDVIDLRLTGGTAGGLWSFVVAPPEGSSFRTGYYPNVQVYAFRTAGHPGLDIAGEGRGCGHVFGAFEVRTVKYTAGTITQLDLLFEQHCEFATPALFGELRLDATQTAGIVVSSTTITWPSLPLGDIGTAVPLYIRNLGTTSSAVGTFSTDGPDVSMVTVTADQCSGRTLGPGDSCSAVLGFNPTARGPRHASLNVPIGTAVNRVSLDGLVRPGDTYLQMHSEAGDYVGQGRDYNFTPADTEFRLIGSQTGLAASASTSDGQLWDIDLAPGRGQVLEPGDYPNAVRYPSLDERNSLSVTGDGRGCNTLTGSFHIDQLVFSPIDASVVNFLGTFVQHCEGMEAALTGTLAWSSEPVTAAPPGVSNLSVADSGSDEAVSWSNPNYAGYSYTVIRVQDANPLDPRAVTGWSVYEGASTSAVVSQLIPGDVRTVTAFTVDSYGNVSVPAQLTFSHGSAGETACTSATLETSVESPQAPGATVPFSARSTGCSNPEYRFFLQTPGGSWTATSRWGGASWAWNTTGLKTGVYGVEVLARQVGSTRPFDAYWIGTYSLTVTPCTAVVVRTTTTSPQEPGGSITFAAYATRCPDAVFRFWLQPKGGAWTMKQDYGSNTWVWNTKGFAPGIYEVGVWARESGSENSYDAYGITTFVLGSGLCISTDLSEGNGPTSGPMAPGGVTVFIAFGNGCANARYQFWLLPPGGKWTVKQPYGENSTWSWDTTGLPTGTYQVGVWAKSSSSSRTYDAYFIRTYRLDVGRCTAVAITSSPPAPQRAGTSITFFGSATGCSAPDYEFWQLSPTGTSWQVVRPYGSGNTFVWNTTGKSGPYRIGVWARQAGSTAAYDAYAIMTFWVGG